MPGGLVSLVYDRRLWDRDGREWACAEPADFATAERLCAGTRPVAVLRANDHAVTWVQPAEFWTSIRDPDAPRCVEYNGPRERSLMSDGLAS